MASVAAATVLVGLLCVLAPAADAEPQPVYNGPDADGSDYETAVVELDPIHLDAFETGDWEDAAETLIPEPDIDVPGVDYWALKSAEFELIDGDGNPIPRHDVHLHHFVIATVNEIDVACPSRQVFGLDVRPHVGTGGERTPIHIPDPYAQKVQDDDIWGANWHLMNMSDEAIDVTVRYTISYDPDATDANTRWVEPWFLSVDQEGTVCGDQLFDVPGGGGSGSTWTKSGTWTIPYDGLVVATGGHLHEGGIATELTTDDGETICHSPVEYEGGHPPSHGFHIERIIPCQVNHHIEAGTELTLDATYDNLQPYDDVMGINLTYIWPGDQSAGLATFPDVPADHLFFDEVAWAAHEGVTEGDDLGNFRPLDYLTRQAYVSFLYRLAGSPAVVGTAPSFPDVPADHPFHDDITWAASEGIVTGYDDGLFGPDRFVTRQAAVAFLYRLAGEPEGPYDLPDLVDIGPEHVFLEPISWAVAEGIVTGYGDHRFRGRQEVTRQAGATFLFREAAWQREVDLWAAYIARFGWAP